MTSAATSDPEAMQAPASCSLTARAERLAPAGTAGTPAGFLLVDWPLPWPADLAEIDGLAAIRDLAGRRGLRVQATVPLEGRGRRAALYAPAAGAGSGGTGSGGAGSGGTGSGGTGSGGTGSGDRGFGGYQGREVVAGAGAGELDDAVASLLAGSVGDPVGEGEVLVCTHGRRDTCCGSFGTSLALELLSSGPGSDGIGRDVRRTSHTGGHRFAPTAIVLPEGTLWAFADRDLLGRVTARRGPIDDVAARYRGCAGLGSPAIQALEAAVLARTGWSLFSWMRRGQRLEGDRHRLTLTGPDDAEGATWEADVVAGRRVALPECGSTNAAGKPAGELDVTALRRVA